MYTCPEKDIHSVYIDNELPEAYIAEYEAHVKNCPKCAAELALLRNLHSVFEADSCNITLDSRAMDDSFERLQARLSYSKIAKANSGSSNGIKFRDTVKYIAAGVAAAAVFAVVIPVRTAKTTHAPASDFKPVARVSLSSPVQHIRTDGKIDTATLSNLLGSSENTAGAIPMTVSAIPGLNSIPYAKTVSTSPSFARYDVFTPVFEDEHNNSLSETPRGFSFYISSPTANITFVTGN